MNRRLAALPAFAMGLVIALAACGGAASTAPIASAGASDRPGPQRVVIDTDLGADDLLALAVLLSDDRVQIDAVTVAATGLAHCEGGVQVLRGFLHELGADGVPVGCGRETPGPGGRSFPDAWRAASDAGYGLALPSEAPAATAAAAEVLAAAIEGADAVTIVELGPWTNLQDLFAAEPAVVERVSAIHAMGGTLDAPGNVFGDDGTPVDPSLEWNIAADPAAVAAVLALDVPVRLVTLDATDQVPLNAAIYAELASDHRSAGANLAFELLTRNQYLIQGGTFLWDELAALALLDPDLVAWEESTISVAASGAEAGHISRSDGGRTVTTTTSAAPASATEAFLAALSAGPQRPDPFELAGELSATWDGERCGTDFTGELVAGVYRLTFSNSAEGTVAFALVAVAAPHTWDEVRQLAEEIDPQAGEPPPAWISLTGQAFADAGRTGEAIANVASGVIGPVCLAGPDEASLTYHLGQPVTVP